MAWEGQDLSLAVDSLEKAVVLDPEFALAHAVLSSAYSQTYFSAEDSSQARLLMARRSAERALELEPDLPEGHAAMGHILWEYDFDMVGAQSAFDRAFEINPSLMYGMIPYGYFLLSLKRYDESAEVALTVARLDPVSPWAQRYSLNLLARAGRIEEAIAQIYKAVELFPDQKANVHFVVANAYVEAGRHDLALGQPGLRQRLRCLICVKTTKHVERDCDLIVVRYRLNIYAALYRNCKRRRQVS